MADYPVSPAEVNDTVPENEPDTVGTPEGEGRHVFDRTTACSVTF